MLSDTQSLVLCGLMAIGIFVSGVLGILDNNITITILIIVFLFIVVNLFFFKNTNGFRGSKEEKD